MAAPPAADSAMAGTLPELPLHGDAQNPRLAESMLLGSAVSTPASCDGSPLALSPRSTFDFSWVPGPDRRIVGDASLTPRSSTSSVTSSPSCGGHGHGYGYSCVDGFGAHRQRLSSSSAHAHGGPPPLGPRAACPLTLALTCASQAQAQPSAASPTSQASSSFSSSRSSSGPTSVPSSSLPPLALATRIDTAVYPHSHPQPQPQPAATGLGSSSSSNTSPTGVAFISSATTSPSSISPLSIRPPVNIKMPPRPAKRSADGGGPSDDDANGSSAGKLKLARSDRGPDDFSSVVKNRLQSYTRTGQACDRCKVRKIRCDALPEGCSHCINLNLECNVTDRVTGRTERRGYMQQLEREKNSMIAHIRDLERLCADKGVDVKPWQGGPRAQSPPEFTHDDMGSASDSSPSTENWSQYHSLWIKDTSSPKPASNIIRHQVPRNEWQTRPQQAHWGVGADVAPLSSLKGMTLTLLGTTIETTSFDAPDVDEPPTIADPSIPLYNKSVQAFLRSAMGVNPAVHVELPTRENAFIYADWFFITVASFMPLLHKPTFMKLLTRLYDEHHFKPSVSELVLVHMVFAIILFQFGVRNSPTLEQRNNYNDLSNRHYHFALSKMYEIFSSTEFEALQGLVLIASHTRAFPKPGCGSLVASMALHRALELNFHRRSNKLGEPTNLQNELRKRAWWNIMTVVVAINGKRGYPLPVSVQDFDVDFPEPIADELLSDEGVDTSRTIPCPYEIAISGFKVIPIYMEMYANVFSVRRDEGNYKNVLASLEAQMDKWEADLPETMRLDPPKQHDHEMVGPLFARTFMLEFRLHIRHPSLAMTTDKDMIAENTRICEEAAREYLQTVEHLSKMKALDTTWYQMSIYCVAILSMLVPQWERRYEITPVEVARLQDEMDRWTNVVKEMSALLGCGVGMSTQISQMINRTMAWIAHDMQHKGLDKQIQAAVSAKQEQEQQQPLQATIPPVPQAQQLDQTAHYGNATNQHPSLPAARSSQGEEELTKSFYQTNNTAAAHATYQPLGYVDESNPQSAASYQHNQAGLFYPTTTTAATAGHPTGPAQANPLISYANEAGQHLSHQNPDMMWRTSWQNWSAAIADSQERYSANALLTLGSADGGRNSVIAPIITGDGMPHTGGELPMMPQPAEWPLIMFDQVPRE